MSRLYLLACASVGALAVTCSALAQNAVTTPEIVVTGRKAVKPAKKKRPVPPGPVVQAAPAQTVSAEASDSFPQTIARPPGQTMTTVDAGRLKAAPVFSIGDLLMESPGISIKQGNGPRDIGVSIRGSNARNGFAIKNIVMMEDGFPVTQPDGLSRTDLTDPHAYGAIDVYRGPSSAMFGNYATGGAINFRMRPGREVDGLEYGLDAGSFNYWNNYVTVGTKKGNFEGTAFGSDVRGDGFISHSQYNTQTANVIGNYSVTPDDKITVKFINNLLFGNLPIRQSLNQFLTNPFQQGCAVAATAAAGCPTVTLSGIAQTADQGRFNRDDRRTIVGARWEHSFDKDTTWRTQFVFDDRNINQPTGATSAIGDFPSYNVISDLTKHGQLFGFDATHYVAMFYNSMNSSSDTVPVTAGGGLGLKTSNVAADQYNVGVRAREEINFTKQWTGVLGFGYEYSKISAVSSAFTYPGGVTKITPTIADREFYNLAPEAALRYRPNNEWQYRARVATGYGIPQAGNLFVTPAGVAGNNTNLQAQTNLGYDLGFDWTPGSNVKLSVTGFYEFFKNEFVTQSPGAGLLSYTFNAPKSEHRGVEVALDWRPGPGWRLVSAYTYNDQIYTDYTEQLTAGATTARFNRIGNKIPGVSPQELTSRVGYDEPSGSLAGLGGFVEYVWKDSFFMENGNVLKAPGYSLVNINVHYDKKINDGYIKGVLFYFETKNLFDKTYVASANNITNTITGAGVQNPGTVLASTGTGSIYAGAPRSFFGGMKLRF
jgi:iron complex outermembrane receptor protein